MKNLRTAMLCAGISLCSLVATAQQSNSIPLNEPDQNKPQLFSALPEQIVFNVKSLTDLLAAPVGSPVNISLGDAMQFQGQVISTANDQDDKVNAVNSIVIRSTNYVGARLTFTQTVIDGQVTYSGRILSLKHGDLFELQTKNGQYIFTKKKLYDLVNE